MRKSNRMTNGSVSKNLCVSMFFLLCIRTVPLEAQRIAVLESNSAELASDFYGKPNYRIILRELFEKKDSIWVSIDYDKYDDTTSDQTSSSFLYRQYFSFEPNANGVKISGKRIVNKNQISFSKLYKPEGLKGIRLKKMPEIIAFENLGVNKYKILSSCPKVSQQKIHKPATLSDNEFDRINQAVKKRLEHCNITEPAIQNHIITEHNDTNYVKTVSLPDSAKLVFIRHGSPYVGNCFHCCGGSYSGKQLCCYISSIGDVHVLYSTMELLEHGDFDNDGKEEYIFYFSVFNTYAYLLFYDDFKHNSIVEWNYH